MSEYNRPGCGQVFYSKRNQVSYDCNRECVMKVFTGREDFFQEYRLYNLLRASGHLRIPDLLDVDIRTQTLWLEFLQDDTLLTTLTEDEEAGNTEAAVGHLLKLFQWLDKFYEATEGKLILRDVNFRNYILYQGSMYGFDFEMVTEGNPEEEYCMVLAMYLMYDPIETVFKEEVCQRLIELRKMPSYCWESIGRCMAEIRQRRNG